VKTCRKCGETKPVSEFRRNPRVRDGLSSWCSECHRDATRRWRSDPANREGENSKRRLKPSERLAAQRW
jgi:hypothetical protein